MNKLTASTTVVEKKDRMQSLRATAAAHGDTEMVALVDSYVAMKKRYSEALVDESLAEKNLHEAALGYSKAKAACSDARKEEWAGLNALAARGQARELARMQERELEQSQKKRKTRKK